MIALGIPAKALSEQMGHKSMRMIDETYTHLMREHHAIIAERIGVDKGKKPEAKEPEKPHWIWSPDLDRPLTDAEFEILRAQMIIDISRNNLEGKKSPRT